MRTLCGTVGLLHSYVNHQVPEEVRLFVYQVYWTGGAVTLAEVYEGKLNLGVSWIFERKEPASMTCENVV